MHNTHNHTTQYTLIELAGILEDLAAGCDHEFDAMYDDLEREFAELRCCISNG
jgi:hypothetical protein